jgi:hypothetical protein
MSNSFWLKSHELVNKYFTAWPKESETESQGVKPQYEITQQTQ